MNIENSPSESTHDSLDVGSSPEHLQRKSYQKPLLQRISSSEAEGAKAASPTETNFLSVGPS